MIRTACRFIFHLQGWTFVNQVPDDLRSFLMIGAPHTSNLDFIPAMTVAQMMKRNAKFVIKSEWTKFPFGLFMKPAGAHGLDREKLSDKDHKSNVEIMADLFKQYDELALLIAPEGTRKATDHWRTGFYYIAQKAQVPIVLGFIDATRKEAGLGKVIYPKDFEEDMRIIMDFYKDKTGIVPKNFLLDSRFVS